MTNDLIKHHFSDGLYSKETHIPEGMMLMQHIHAYSHMSILAKGKVVFLKGDEKMIIEAPACIEISAGEHHAVKALTDCVWFCIHATDEKDPSKVDQVLIKEN
jgi:quercetin dioxygenase-like cupin family protein